MKKILINIMYLLISLIFVLPFVGIVIRGLNFKYWCHILGSIEIYEVLGTTTIVSTIALFINFIIGTPLAAFMSKGKGKYKFILEILIILPLIVPAMVSTMGLQFAFIKFNLIETTIGVGVVHSVVTLPYYVQSMRAGYDTINSDYFKLGKILGVNPIVSFFKITLPLLLPSFLVATGLVIIISLAQYLITFIIGGGVVVTLPILMMPYLSDGDVGSGTVYSIIYILFTYGLVVCIDRAIKRIYIIKEKK